MNKIQHRTWMTKKLPIQVEANILHRVMPKPQLPQPTKDFLPMDQPTTVTP